VTIIRREHNGNFTIVPNAIFADRRLSIEAIGTLGYLLSRPPNWSARHDHLKKTLGLGRQKFERVMRELISAGYAERDSEQPRDRNNQFSSYNYVIRDVALAGPPTGEPLSGFPQRRSRCRKPDNGNKKEIIKTNPNKTPSIVSPKGQAEAPLAGDEELTEFGLAARDAGCRFIYEGSKPFTAWQAFRGDDGMPPIDTVIEGGVERRGVWLASLYPPRTVQMNGGDE
jgi:hypothetical protein